MTDFFAESRHRQELNKRFDTLNEKIDLFFKRQEEQTTLLMMLVSSLDTEKLKETIKADKVLGKRLDKLGIKL